MDRGDWWTTVHGVTESQTRLSNTQYEVRAFPGDSVVKESACQCRRCRRHRDTGSIPGLGRSPGEGNGNPLQYSCLENSMDKEAWRATDYGVAKSQTWLSTHTLKGAWSSEIWTQKAQENGNMGQVKSCLHSNLCFTFCPCDRKQINTFVELRFLYL